jgi:hypothetical protein
MSDLAKREFALSVKRLRYFFNHIKEVRDVEKMHQLACAETLSKDEADQVTKWMEEATKAIVEAKRFNELIEVQEM